MKNLPFKPFVYFQFQNQSGKKPKYHIHILISIPDGFKAIPKKVTPGIKIETEIYLDIVPDASCKYTEPSYFYQAILEEDLQRDPDGNRVENKFFVKINSSEELAGQFNLLPMNQKTNPDYDDADGYPAG